MKKWLFVLGFFLLTAGCDKPDDEVVSPDHPTVVDGEITKWKEEVKRLEKNLEETQDSLEMLEQMIMSHDGLGYGELRRQQQMLEDLIKHLPEIEVRTGFIQKVKDESMAVDYAEKVESPEAPNGYEIVNESEEAETLPITEEMTVFVLNGTDLEARTIEEFNPSRHFLFEIYISKGQVIQVREVYVP